MNIELNKYRIPHVFIYCITGSDLMIDFARFDFSNLIGWHAMKIIFIERIITHNLGRMWVVNNNTWQLLTNHHTRSKKFKKKKYITLTIHFSAFIGNGERMQSPYSWRRLQRNVQRIDCRRSKRKSSKDFYLRNVTMWRRVFFSSLRFLCCGTVSERLMHGLTIFWHQNHTMQRQTNEKKSIFTT